MKQQLLETPVFQIKKAGQTFVIDIAPGVAIIPITTRGTLLLVNQYQQGMGEKTLELPAGTKEEGETWQEAAERILLEETGTIAKTMEEMGQIATLPSLTNHYAKIFVAERIAWKQNQSNVQELSLAKVMEKVEKGEIWASNSIAGFYLYVQKYHRDSMF